MADVKTCDMRMIKEGRKPTKEIEKTCKQCGCVFAYDKKDVHCGSQYNESYFWVICPTCGKQISVDRFPNY